MFSKKQYMELLASKQRKVAVHKNLRNSEFVFDFKISENNENREKNK